MEFAHLSTNQMIDETSKTFMPNPFLLVMLSSNYAIALILSLFACVDASNAADVQSSAPQIREEILRLLREVNNKQNTEQHLFASIYEHPSTEKVRDLSPNLDEMKSSLMKLLSKVNKMEAMNKMNNNNNADVQSPSPSSPFDSGTSSSSSSSPAVNNNATSLFVGDNKRKRNQEKWGKWTEWAPCSVTCGKGRKIRWRHCALKCDAETEMEELTCQLPACTPSKLFGVIPV